ncbi:Seipin-3 [Hirschfeldia incana]|nr:Seipin-3 [Hirschfeldia incana]
MNGEKPETLADTTITDHRGDDFLREATSKDWSLLGSLATLVIKSIEFQVSLMLTFIKFPPCLIHICLSFVTDPYRTMRRGRRYLLSKVVELCEFGLKDDNKHVLKAVRRLALGLLWAMHVGIVLFAMLAFAFMVSGFVITCLTHEPLVVKESLSFDYTKYSPEAYVPITRVNTPNHRTEVSVSMTLPESEYNRNLGMFQVRVDFLSENGQVLATSRRPCMLRFRTEPIRLVQTFIKIVPLVSGYVSETQTLNLKLKGFAEKDIIGTACMKVMIEQRAELRRGAGIPEIYDASLLLKSEFPFLKSIIWKWRRTLFVWISMNLFITELVCVLVFYMCVIIPRTGGQRTQQSDGAPSGSNISNLICSGGK